MNDRTGPSVRDLAPVWPVDHPFYSYLRATEGYPGEARVQLAGEGPMLMLGSYSYLDLNNHPRINRAAQKAIERYGTGTHGVRLLSGTLDLHRQLEAGVAAFKQTEDAVSFSSGYHANLATIASLVGEQDAVVCDRLDHASIVDGCRLSRARMLRFRHNDPDSLARSLARCEGARRKLVVVDAVYSMDGDVADLPAISRVCRQHRAWLMVDEAHSLGVLGATGHGIEEHFGMPADIVDVKMGTFSKAIPSSGGYVAGARELCSFVAHESRAFIYSASLAPASAAAALEALNVIEDEPERVTRLHHNVAFFAARLRALGVEHLNSTTPIFPIMCGESERAVRAAWHCKTQGIYVHAIPEPVVPRGTARLRASVTAAHRESDLEFCAAVIREALGA